MNWLDEFDIPILNIGNTHKKRDRFVKYEIGGTFGNTNDSNSNFNDTDSNRTYTYSDSLKPNYTDQMRINKSPGINQQKYSDLELQQPSINLDKYNARKYQRYSEAEVKAYKKMVERGLMAERIHNGVASFVPVDKPLEPKDFEVASAIFPAVGVVSDVIDDTTAISNAMKGNFDTIKTLVSDRAASGAKDRLTDIGLRKLGLK